MSGEELFPKKEIQSVTEPISQNIKKFEVINLCEYLFCYKYGHNNSIISVFRIPNYFEYRNCFN